MATAFDTLAAARALEDAGLERRRAEAVAAMGRRAAGADRDQAATKADLYAVTADLRELRAEFRTAMAFVAALLIAMSGRSFGVFRAATGRRDARGRPPAGIARHPRPYRPVPAPSPAAAAPGRPARAPRYAFAAAPLRAARTRAGIMPGSEPRPRPWKRESRLAAMDVADRAPALGNFWEKIRGGGVPRPIEGATGSRTGRR